MKARAALLAAIPQLRGRHILVIGDLFLDEHLLGRATRLSREAPIPVVEFEEQQQRPGGGANPAVNIVALGGRVTQVGVVGDDSAGRTLTQLLSDAGIGVEGLVTDPQRPTTTKTRIVSRGSLRFPQQLARLDRIDRRPLAAEVEAQVVSRITALAPHTDAILISDYRSGLVTPAVIAAVRRVRRPAQLICVDTQGRLGQFTGFDLAKCNHHEAQDYVRRTTGRVPPLRTETDLRQAISRLRDQLDLGVLIITRGAEGLSLQAGDEYLHLPAANRTQVYDVTGAGDTVIAVATLAMAAGHPPALAATLANYAAGLVVRKLGVAAPSPDELAWAIERW